MAQSLELSVKPCKASVITSITKLHDINTLVKNGKIDVLSREIETIKRNEIEIL